MTSELYYGNILIGSITDIKSDFPNLCGYFNLLLKPIDIISSQITEYINFSPELIEFYLNTCEIDQKAENILLEKENLYQNLIDSNEWKLVDLKGEVTKILIPTFDKEGIITLRFNI